MMILLQCYHKMSNNKLVFFKKLQTKKFFLQPQFYHKMFSNKSATVCHLFNKSFIRRKVTTSNLCTHSWFSLPVSPIYIDIYAIQKLMQNSKYFLDI